MRYKVVELMHGDFVAEGGSKETKFEGSLEELDTRFPKSRISGVDQFSHREIEDGCIRWDYYFYKSTDGLSWEECDDPRSSNSSRPLTDLERAIDRENRAMFPGDFVKDDLFDYDDFDPNAADEDWYY